MLKRSCIACRNIDDKSRLIRIVIKDDKPVYDINQKINSRGIYLCKNRHCLDSLIKRLEKNKIKLKVDFNKEELIELLLELKNLRSVNN